MREPYVLKLANGSALELRYTFKSLRFIEREIGGHFFTDSMTKLGTAYISAGIAAGLLWKHHDMTTGKVDNLLEAHLEAGGALPDVLDGLVAAFKHSGVLLRPDNEPQESPTSALERPTPDADPAAP